MRDRDGQEPGESLRRYLAPLLRGRRVLGVRRAVPTAVLSALLLANGATPAIVMRHDVDEKAYLDLGARYPAVVKVRRKRAGSRTGAEGTLIAPRWILTAAHVAATLGHGDIALVGGKKRSIDRIVRHPDWKSEADMNVDVALLELTFPAEGIAPVPLCDGGEKVGAEVVFVGRGGQGDGRTGPTGEDGRVRGATNRIEKVGKTFIRFRFDAPGDPDVTKLEGISGPGDSGGPALLEEDGRPCIAGISSGQDAKPAGGKVGHYGVLEYYARVSAFSPWIRSVMSSPAATAPGTPLD